MTTRKESKWLKLVIIALFLNVTISPVVRYVNGFGISSSISASIFFSLATFTMLTYLLIKKEDLKINKKNFYLIALTALLMTILNLALWNAVVIVIRF